MELVCEEEVERIHNFAVRMSMKINSFPSQDRGLEQISNLQGRKKLCFWLWWVMTTGMTAFQTNFSSCL